MTEDYPKQIFEFLADGSVRVRAENTASPEEFAHIEKLKESLIASTQPERDEIYRWLHIVFKCRM